MTKSQRHAHCARMHTNAHAHTFTDAHSLGSMQHFFTFFSYLSLICRLFPPRLLISFFPSRPLHLSVSLSLFPSAGFPEQTVSVAAIEFPWMRMTDRQQVPGAADASGESDYQSLLLLGAIAAASAFVVTILIVLICVGCQR